VIGVRDGTTAVVENGRRFPLGTWMEYIREHGTAEKEGRGFAEKNQTRAELTKGNRPNREGSRRNTAN